MCRFLLLCLVGLPMAFGLNLEFARAAIIVDTNPGDVGEFFATKVFSVPELVGLPAAMVTGPQVTEDWSQIDFLFPDDKFVRSFPFRAGPRVFELELIYDRPFPVGAIGIGGGSQFGGNGFVLDALGNRIRASSFTQTQLFSENPRLLFSIGPDPNFALPPGTERSVPYYGAHFQWGFSEVGVDAPLITSAILTFKDTRGTLFPTGPVPHLVGRDVPVPEPASWMLVVGILVAVIGPRAWGAGT